jgi:hypothetical protein
MVRWKSSSLLQDTRQVELLASQPVVSLLSDGKLDALTLGQRDVGLAALT